MKARRAVDLDVPSAAPCEATLKDQRAAEPEATVKDRRAADRCFALAAASELTIRERSEWPTWRASERPAPADLPIVLPAEAQQRAPTDTPMLSPSFDVPMHHRTPHVPPAATFEATIKDRSTVDLDVPPPVSPASEWPTSRPGDWLTWWLTWRSNESSTPAELPMVPPANAQRAPTGTPMPSPVVAQSLGASFAANVRSPITRRARTWIVVTALLVATIAGTVAFIYGATNDSATNLLDAVGGAP
jgi:hypothetical protein